mgnify:CR=1 FL=1
MRDLGRESEDSEKDIKESAVIGEENDLNNDNSKVTEVRLAESQARLASLQERLSVIMRDSSNEVRDQMEIAPSNEEENNEEEEDDDTKQCKGLFKELKFFLGREVFSSSIKLFHQIIRLLE